jgi:hypothetical protein
MRAWAWLIEQQDEELIASWDQTQDLLRGAGVSTTVLMGIRVVSWQNRTLTLAGWLRHRRWFARRYIDLTMAVVKTDHRPVFVTPRVGATMARKIMRDKENDDGTQ